MKSSFIMLMVAVAFGGSVYGGYDYVIESGYGLPSLHGNASLLMTGGGGGELYMTDHSLARIEGTSPLQQGFGGIWELGVAGESHLEFVGGEIHQLDLGTHGTAILSGGRIEQIQSGQSAWKYDGDPPVLVPNPHITIVCDLDSVTHNTQTNVLTGDWLDGTAFNIQLIDVAGYSPAIENIQFIPEPATLLLIGVGMLLVRKRR